MKFFLRRAKQTYVNLERGWNNDDGYVQPIVSFNGMLILMVVMLGLGILALHSA